MSEKPDSFDAAVRSRLEKRRQAQAADRVEAERAAARASKERLSAERVAGLQRETDERRREIRCAVVAEVDADLQAFLKFVRDDGRKMPAQLEVPADTGVRHEPRAGISRLLLGETKLVSVGRPAHVVSGFLLKVEKSSVTRIEQHYPTSGGYQGSMDSPGSTKTLSCDRYSGLAVCVDGQLVRWSATSSEVMTKSERYSADSIGSTTPWSSCALTQDLGLKLMITGMASVQDLVPLDSINPNVPDEARRLVRSWRALFADLAVA